MDAYEATRSVFSRIQALDPDNAAKIMGLLLMQDHSEKEMIRLAFGPESLLHSVVLKARADLGSPSSWAPPPVFSRSNSGNGSAADGDLVNSPFYNNVDLVDELSLGSDPSGFGWRPCLYFARGYCKNGSSCRFVHEQMLMRSKSQRLMSSAAFPFSPTGSLPPSPSSSLSSAMAMNFLLQQQQQQQLQSDSQRAAAAAALMLGGDDTHKFLGRPRIDRGEFAGIVNPSSRQIYLTFPADSTFREEDVTNYFSIYGPVQDVRIPYQQKRMFGFVTFVYPETVKLILAKGNPHFVCDSRVLVKPYKEKGKVPDKYRKQQFGDFSSCNSPTGLDPRDPYDLQQLASRMLYGGGSNQQDALLRRKLEDQQLQQAIELQGRRFMGLNLLDLKTPNFSSSLDAYVSSHSSSDGRSSGGSCEVSPPGGQRLSPVTADAIAVAADHELLYQSSVNAADKKESSADSNIDVDRDFRESGAEHNLPDSPFASPSRAGATATGGATAEPEADSASPLASPHTININSSSSSNIHIMPTSTLDMASFKSCFFQMPRLPSGHGAVGM